MGFDLNKFETTNFKDRTEKVSVPDLKKFFKSKEKPVWEVKGLTGHELAIVNNAVVSNKGKAKLLEAIANDEITEEKINAVMQALNIIKLSDNVPDDLVKRHMTLVLGSVKPECSEALAVKLGVEYPAVLFLLSQRIYELTGKGRVGE